MPNIALAIDGNEPDPIPVNNTDDEIVKPVKCPQGVKCLTARATRK